MRDKKVSIGNLRKTKEMYNDKRVSGYVKPASKFYKRLFNKRIRQSKDLRLFKRCNYFYWS